MTSNQLIIPVRAGQIVTVGLTFRRINHSLQCRPTDEPPIAWHGQINLLGANPAREAADRHLAALETAYVAQADTNRLCWNNRHCGGWRAHVRW